MTSESTTTITQTDNNTAAVAARFHELAQQEKWFDIQEELFADDVKSIEPSGSTFLPDAEGKAAVRKKGETFVQTIEALHYARTSHPVVAGNHFAVGREKEMVVQGRGTIRIHQIMMYEVKEGKIVKEQFFY